VKPKDVLIAAGSVGRETLWFLANVEPEMVDEILRPKRRKQVAKDLIPFDVASVVSSLSHQKILLMHDLAEGGLATSITELSRAAGLGLTIQYDTIPWDTNIVQLCTNLGWNPLHCSSFGSFLIVTDRTDASSVLHELNQHNRPAAIIGEFTANQELLLNRAGKITPLPKGHDPYKDYTAKIT
jgi:hydrogenase maturation factor